jgi:hypothetical protein
MQPLKITLGPKARRWNCLAGAILMVVSVVISVWFGLMRHLASFGLTLGIILAVYFLYYFVGLTTSYTECTAEHLRTRRLGRRRVTPWSQVRDIARYVVTGRGTSYYVRVTTTEGKKFYLGGFPSSYGMAGKVDPEFPEHLQQVIDFWHAVAGTQAVTG